MEVLNIRLLTHQEFDEYKEKIPDIHHPWWISDESRKSSLFVGFVGLGNNINYTYTHMPGIGLRPVLDVKSVLRPTHKRIKIYDMWWTVLTPSLLIAEECVSDLFFSEYRSDIFPDYQSSEIKEYSDNWLEFKKQSGDYEYCPPVPNQTDQTKQPPKTDTDTVIQNG